MDSNNTPANDNKQNPQPLTNKLKSPKELEAVVNQKLKKKRNRIIINVILLGLIGLMILSFLLIR